MEGGPLHFHKVHGRNVKLSADMRRATRVKDYRKAVCFSHRPIAVNEQVHVEIIDVSNCWRGVIRIGFTSFNPAKTNRDRLPANMSGGSTKVPGYWAIQLSQRFAKKGKVWSFYVTPDGYGIYGVCGVEEDIQFSGLDTSRRLWAVIDIYGNTTSVQIVGVTSSDVTSATYRPSRIDRSLQSSHSQSDVDECVACMDQPTNSVLVPCAHTCLCYTCAVRIRKSDNASCPICRHVIDGVSKLSYA